ncbi:hypothetical protein O4H51_21740 [Aeromonas hydrophila]|uniref:hypothetical protein n=1 Tax=Aeromonas hydrophila TaxID=644 RepID=UPI0022AF4EEF|nr:hypothetical protein [Aeromonas hydrophila]ELB2790288.1 hypothetical protein [Aeromonas hydrophila]MCZ4335474.1 hypothetical protein [Aeromonas hydrophila]
MDKLLSPGKRAYHPGYYAAVVLDPDDNNIEAVYHGEAKHSAESADIRLYQYVNHQ